MMQRIKDIQNLFSTDIEAANVSIGSNRHALLLFAFAASAWLLCFETFSSVVF